MNTFLKFLGAMVLLIALTFYRLFIIQKVWALAVVSQFHAQPITMWQAFAVSAVASTLMAGIRSPQDQDKDKAFENAAKHCLNSALTLTLMWGITALFF